jgi:hypothetical protein
LSNLQIETDYILFKADFTKFINTEFMSFLSNTLIANNNPLISFVSNNFTQIENTLFYPNRIAQNYYGEPYEPYKFITSPVLLNQNTVTYSPIVLARYNFWDYQVVSANNTVTITIDLEKFPIDQEQLCQTINFQYNNPIAPTAHFVQLIIDATNTNYEINGLKVYTSPAIKVLYSTSEINTDGTETQVSNKMFILRGNGNDIAILEPASDIAQVAGGLELWSNTKSYAVNDIVSLSLGTDMGVFICTVANTGDNPWTTNSWLAYGRTNTYHLTDTIYQASTGINMVMVSAPVGQNVLIELPEIISVKDTWSCTFKACNLTDGNKITINTFHNAQGGHDIFEDGSDTIELIDSSDILTVYMRNGDNRIYYSIGG